MAAVFRVAGTPVTLCDPSEAARRQVDEALARHQQAMNRAGFTQKATAGDVTVVADIEDAAPAELVVEAAVEDQAIKAELFGRLLTHMPETTLLTSASSAMPISAIVPDPNAQRRCLVAHPGNPPSLIRVLELVPGPGTDPGSVDRAYSLFAAAGFKPVAIKNEMPGFVFNRLQSALLREAYRLVGEGVIDVDGVDRLVRDGLGPRWALSGPFETADLNTEGGIRAHAKRLGPAYAAIGAARGETDPKWSPALVDLVEKQQRKILPEADLTKRRAWRETALADLLAARRDLVSKA
jgi:3-hydroxyacyl-CoA dehydrogenase